MFFSFLSGLKVTLVLVRRLFFPETIIDKIHKKAIEKTTNQNNNELEPKDKLHLCLPYVNEQHKRKVYTILRKNRECACLERERDSVQREREIERKREMESVCREREGVCFEIER